MSVRASCAEPQAKPVVQPDLQAAHLLTDGARLKDSFFLLYSIECESLNARIHQRNKSKTFRTFLSCTARCDLSFRAFKIRLLLVINKPTKWSSFLEWGCSPASRSFLCRTTLTRCIPRSMERGNGRVSSKAGCEVCCVCGWGKLGYACLRYSAFKVYQDSGIM